MIRNEMKKIKILFTIGNLDVGGAEKLVINQIKNIDKDKFEPYLCTLFPFGQKNYSEMFAELQGIPHKRLGFRGEFDILNWIRIYKFLRKEKFDILCCHLFQSNFIIRVTNFFAGRRPVFIFEHNIYWQKQWWKILADRLLASQTAKIFVDSNAILDFTSKQEKLSKEKFAILPYPIELVEQIKFDRSKIKQNLGLPQDSFVIGSISRFVQQKGLPYFIKAAAKILKENKRQDIYFLLIGYGKMESELIDLVKELKIESRCFVRQTKNAEEALSIMDIFVVSSLWEGQPLAMLEAMASGKPVVATSVGGIPELIIEEKNGLLAEPKNPDSLASKIMKLVENDEMRLAIGRQGLGTAESFSMPVYIKKLEKYFTDEYAKRNKH